MINYAILLLRQTREAMPYHPPQQRSELVAESLPPLVLSAQGHHTFAFLFSYNIRNGP